MRDLQENIIPAFNQNKGAVYLYKSNGIRVLFVGNSITKHEPKPEVGWTNDCGMAASSVEKDYVHLLVKKIMQYDPDVSFGICQVAGYERKFFEETPDVSYSAAAEFDADVIIMFFGANVNKEYDKMENPPKTFETAYEDMRNYLSHNGKSPVIHCEGFYIRPVLEAEKQKVTAKYGDVFVKLGETNTREETHGKFNHPNDLGMQEIADKIWVELEPVIQKLTAPKK